MGEFGIGSSSGPGRSGFELGPEPGIEDHLIQSWLEAQLFPMDEIGGDAPQFDDYMVNSSEQSLFQFGDNRYFDIGEPMILNRSEDLDYYFPIDQLSDYEFQVDSITPEDFLMFPDYMQPIDDFGGDMEVDFTLQSATSFFSDLPVLQVEDIEIYQTIDTTAIEIAMEKLTLEELKWPVLEPWKSIGITQRKNGTWEAHIWLKDFNLDRARNGMQFFVGSFCTKEDAKMAHDKAAIKLDVRAKKDGTPYSLNYSEDMYEAYMTEHAHLSRRDYLWKMRRDSEKFSTGACSLRGVRLLKNRKGKMTGRYVATTSVTAKKGTNITESSTSKGKKRFLALGSYSTEEEAGRAYDKAILFIQGMYSGCVTNFQPGSYSETEVLEVGQRLTQAYPKVDFDEAHKTTLDCLLRENAD